MLRGVTNDTNRELVRRGYDAVSYLYRSDDAAEDRYAPWLAGLRTRLPAASSVLDLGCGCGVPVSRSLAEAGYQVTGVDISDVQIERARRLVPTGTFIRADAATLDFAHCSFDAVVSLYALFHLPQPEQANVLRKIGSWLRPSGWLLLIAGHEAWTGTDAFLDGQTPMWWSHPDAATYRSWLEQAGLAVTDQGFVPEGDGGHSLFWARRPGAPPVPDASAAQPSA